MLSASAVSSVHMAQAERLALALPDDPTGCYLRGRVGPSRELREVEERHDLEAVDEGYDKLEEEIADTIARWVDERAHGSEEWLWVDLMAPSGKKILRSTLQIRVGGQGSEAKRGTQRAKDDIDFRAVAFDAMSAMTQVTKSTNDRLFDMLADAQRELRSSLEITTEALIARAEAEAWEEANTKGQGREAMAEALQSAVSELGPSAMEMFGTWAQVAQSYVTTMQGQPGAAAGAASGPAPPPEGSDRAAYATWWRSVPPHAQQAIIESMLQRAAKAGGVPPAEDAGVDRVRAWWAGLPPELRAELAAEVPGMGADDHDDLPEEL